MFTLRTLKSASVFCVFPHPAKFIRFDHNGIARASAVILDSETLRVLELCPRGHPARDYASAAGVGSGSDCVATTRERGRLGIDLVGADAASLSTSGFDLERLVRLGLGVV